MGKRQKAAIAAVGATYLLLGIAVAVLLLPHVVPHYDQCTDEVPAAYWRFRAIAWRCFAALALALFGSVLLTSAVRRDSGKPGPAAIVAAAWLGWVAVAVLIDPSTPLIGFAWPFVVLQWIGGFLVVAAVGPLAAALLLVAVLAVSIAQLPRRWRLSALAWAGLLAVLPAIAIGSDAAATGPYFC
jgi:hypothetical protein